jgi:hypothetical protein
MRQRNINELILEQRNKKLSFKERLIETFGINPFICSNCNIDMVLWKIWHYKYGEIYSALDKKHYRDIVDDVIDIKIESIKSEQLKLF